MKRRKQIAVVHYPHYPDSARIDTMPFAANTIKKLSELGYTVDVYLWEKENKNYLSLFSKNISFKFQEDKWIPVVDSFLVRMSPHKYKENTYKFRFKTGKKYDCVFGIGQIGAYIAHLISKRNNAPLVLFNDEFPSAWGMNNWATLELKAAKDSKLIVVPDESRIKPLLKEYNLLDAHPAAILPNISDFKLPSQKINWHKRLNIPENLTLCLNAGTIADFAQVPELMMTVPDWQDNAVLIMNERNSDSLQFAKTQYSHLDIPSKIFWNSTSLSEIEINSLVSSCAINFALYRNTGANIEHIGFSSGKLMRSIAAGVPVIASDLSSFNFVRKHQLGILIKHPNEIPSAIKEILSGKTDYKKNCYEFHQSICAFDNYWNKFAEQFLKLF